MIRRKRLVYTIIIVLIVAIVSITIGYSALNASMNITMNKITQNAMTWDIGFKTGTITGTAVTNNSGNINCGTATATATTISGISTKLSGVGDKCAYTFQIQNNGTIAGKISSINITKPTSTTCTTSGSTMVCGNITYKLHYTSATSTSLVAVNDTIAAKSGTTATTKTVVLTIEHTGTTIETGSYNQNGFSYTINYAQN